MRVSGIPTAIAAPATALWLVLSAACGPTDDQSVATIVEPDLASSYGSSCNFRGMIYDARAYFPGHGASSPKGAVLALLDEMKADCKAGQRASYTEHWYEVAAILEHVLEAGKGGDPQDGGDFLAASVTLPGPGGTPMFDPCDGAAGCTPWEGHPTPPDFASVLGSSHGAWAVVSTGTAALCSSFAHPCEDWDAGLRGDAWGVEPSVTWNASLAGRTTVVFGLPLFGPSPTGEALLDTEIPAYEWQLIPDPDVLGAGHVPPAALEVGLCSTATTSEDELLVQKGPTVLSEALIDWCASQLPSIARASDSFWGRLAAFLSPAPAPLVATLAIRGPGGSAGGFTDFYAVDLPREAAIDFANQPADSRVGKPVIGRDGHPFAVRTSTSSAGTALESAAITLRVVLNPGLVPSGNTVSGAGLDCRGATCTGRTQADQELAPGLLGLPLVITKPGAYKVCVTAHLPPMVFADERCSDRFIVRP